MKRVISAIAFTLLLLSSTPPSWCEQGASPTPSKEQLEALKAQNAKAIKMNALITQAQTAMNAKNWQDAIAPLQELIAIDPGSWPYYSSLGSAQLNLGKYQDAIATYDKGIQAAQNIMSGSAPQNTSDPATDPAKAKAGEASMLTNEGNAYLKLRRNSEAIAAYTKAAALDPNPGTAYFNLCATEYNMGKMEEAASVCDKAIHFDPSKADAYFIKGSAMFGMGNLDAHNQYVVPSGTVEVLQKYLELSPNGSHVPDVKAMLEALGSPIQSTYEQKKK